MNLRILILFVPLLLLACADSQRKEILIYEGPIREAKNVEHYYSEKNLVKIKLTAKAVHEFENGDNEFPEGVKLEFFDEKGKLESTLKANHAYFFKEENKWRGQGNVEVKNLTKKEQLNTEELFWMPGEETISTEKFVTIKLQNDVIYGKGLEAKQDLSTYKILHPSGSLQIEE